MDNEEIICLQHRIRNPLWNSFKKLYQQANEIVVRNEDGRNGGANNNAEIPEQIATLKEFEIILKSLAQGEMDDYIEQEMDYLKRHSYDLAAFPQQIVWSIVRKKHASMGTLARLRLKDHSINFDNWYQTLFEIITSKLIDNPALYDSYLIPSARMKNVIKTKEMIDQSVIEAINCSIDWNTVWFGADNNPNPNPNSSYNVNYDRNADNRSPSRASSDQPHRFSSSPNPNSSLRSSSKSREQQQPQQPQQQSHSQSQSQSRQQQQQQGLVNFGNRVLPSSSLAASRPNSNVNSNSSNSNGGSSDQGSKNGDNINNLRKESELQIKYIYDKISQQFNEMRKYQKSLEDKMDSFDNKLNMEKLESKKRADQLSEQIKLTSQTGHGSAIYDASSHDDYNRNYNNDRHRDRNYDYNYDYDGNRPDQGRSGNDQDRNTSNNNNNRRVYDRPSRLIQRPSFYDEPNNVDNKKRYDNGNSSQDNCQVYKKRYNTNPQETKVTDPILNSFGDGSKIIKPDAKSAFEKVMRQSSASQHQQPPLLRKEPKEDKKIQPIIPWDEFNNSNINSNNNSNSNSNINTTHSSNSSSNNVSNSNIDTHDVNPNLDLDPRVNNSSDVDNNINFNVSNNNVGHINPIPSIPLTSINVDVNNNNSNNGGRERSSNLKSPLKNYGVSIENDNNNSPVFFTTTAPMINNNNLANNNSSKTSASVNNNANNPYDFDDELEREKSKLPQEEHPKS